MNRYALIVGISQYRYFPQLPRSANSAEAVAQLLRVHGNFQDVQPLPMNWVGDRYEIGRDLLLPKAELMDKIKHLLKEQAKGGVALLFFSGHGFTVPDDAIEGRFEAYLAASDTEIGVEAGQVVSHKNGISLRSLARLFANAEVSSLVVLLDCCHSGSLVECNEIFQQALAANSSSSKVYIITACRDFETAYAGTDGNGYTVFTSALLAGLQSARANDQGQVVTDQLSAYISQAMRGAGQEPKRLGLADPIAIVTYPPSELPPVETSFNPANPYVGLAAFESFQADYFFGRDGEIKSLLERLDPLQTPARRFLAVIGPSGSGKSSLVKAGLVPALAKDALPESSEWQIEPLKPGAFPLAALNAAIAKYTDAQPHLLVIDQFEELFTLCQSEEEQRAFLALLNQQVTRADRQARVVITMRADFLDRCARYQESADLINQLQPTTFMVTPLTDDNLAAQLGQAIVQPATQHGVEFQPGLAAQMSSDVRNQLGALPLLQYALTELWNHCIPDGAAEPCLTWVGYEAIGGVRGALQRRADSLYASLTESDRDLLKKLVMELVQIGDGGEVSRRRAERQELWALTAREQVDRLLDRLTSERFLMVDGETVEVAHEALLSEAPQIRGWIEENRENLRQRDRFERDCREWQEQERSDFYLLNPGKLAAVEEWIENTKPGLSPVQEEFVGESVKERDRETDEKINTEKKKKWNAIRVGGLATAVMVLWSLNYFNQLQAEHSKKRSIATLIGKADGFFETHNELQALSASVEALKELQIMNIENSDDLEKVKNLISKIRKRSEFKAHTSQVSSINFSPDGKLLASGGTDGFLKIWSLEEKKRIDSNYSPVHQRRISAVEFSPDGKLLASASYDGIVKIWTNQGKFLYSLSSNKKDVILSISFNSDSSLLAASSSSGNITIWNVRNKYGVPDEFYSQVESSRDKRILSLKFHPKDRVMLTVAGFKNYDMAVWDIKQPHEKPKKVGTVSTAAQLVRYDKGGDLVASLRSDKTNVGMIEIRDFTDANMKVVGRIHDKQSTFSYFEFSPSNEFIVSVSSDGNIRVWDVSRALNIWKAKNPQTLEKSVEMYTIHTKSAYQIGFKSLPSDLGRHQTSQILASANYDGNIEIWETVNNPNSLPYEVRSDVLINQACSILISHLKMTDLSRDEKFRKDDLSKPCK